MLLVRLIVRQIELGLADLLFQQHTILRNILLISDLLDQYSHMAG